MRRKAMTAAEVACMLEHGAHDWSIYNTRWDSVRQFFADKLARWLWNRKHKDDKGGMMFPPWLRVAHYHEVCLHCGKRRRA